MSSGEGSCDYMGCDRHTIESAYIIRFILQVLQDYYFYDCPGFSVLIGDFSNRLSTGFAQKAAQDTAD